MRLNRFAGAVAVAALAVAGAGCLPVHQGLGCLALTPFGHGPYGQIQRVVASGSRLAVATRGGALYVGNGSRWRKLSTALPGDLVAAAGARLYADSDSLYRSANGGRSWVRLSCAWLVTRVAVSPNDPRTIYVAAIPEELYPNRGGGLYRTTDGGLTWRRFTSFPPQDPSITAEPEVNAVAVDPADPRRVYTALESGGIERSGDGGDDWRLSTIDPRKPYWDIPQVAQIAIGPGRLWITTRDYSVFRVFRSDDGGEHWTPASAGRRGIDDVVPDSRRRTVAYAVTDEDRLLRTTDGGVSWRPIPGGPPRVNGLSIRAADDTLYAWNARTIFSSGDHGATWTRLPPLPR